MNENTNIQRPNKLKLHEFISHEMESKNIKNVEIAEYMGFKNVNNISMFKTGKTRVPYDRIPKLARAIGVDKSLLMRMAFMEYDPEKLKAIQECVGYLLTDNEKEIINKIREMTGNSDPSINTKLKKEALEKFAEALKK